MKKNDCMNTKEVSIYVIRHGDKDSESGPNDLALLSKKGEQQILQSAMNNLEELSFEGLYCSRKYRTLQAVTLVCGILPLRNRGMSVIARDAFDYSGAPDLETFNEDERNIRDVCAKSGRLVTIDDWIKTSPRMTKFLGGRLQKELCQIAKVHASKSFLSSFNVLAGSHTVVGELACVDPTKMFPLKEADIVKYVVKVFFEGAGVHARIISSEFIDRGF